jgi:hypothetical protein
MLVVLSATAWRDRVYAWMRHDRAGYFWLIERYCRIGRAAEFDLHLVIACAAGARSAARGGAAPARRGAPAGSRRHRAACGIPSVALEEPSFSPGFSLWRCWRGPSWMNTAWLLVPAMRALGYYEDASRVIESLEVTVDRYGYREYYNPFTGRGLAARAFGFSC